MGYLCLTHFTPISDLKPGSGTNTAQIPLVDSLQIPLNKWNTLFLILLGFSAVSDTAFRIEWDWWSNYMLWFVMYVVRIPLTLEYQILGNLFPKFVLSLFGSGPWHSGRNFNFSPKKVPGNIICLLCSCTSTDWLHISFSRRTNSDCPRAFQVGKMAYGEGWSSFSSCSAVPFPIMLSNVWGWVPLPLKSHCLS